jgi:hypothetical protein
MLSPRPPKLERPTDLSNWAKNKPALNEEFAGGYILRGRDVWKQAEQRDIQYVEPQ